MGRWKNRQRDSQAYRRRAKYMMAGGPRERQSYGMKQERKVWKVERMDKQMERRRRTNRRTAGLTKRGTERRSRDRQTDRQRDTQTERERISTE